MFSKIPKISVIILNWNGKEDTLECLDSVQEIEYSNYQIIVVDNGSTDDSVTAIKDKFPQLLVLENKANLGFAAGNNVGIEYALSEEVDYIFLLNNDTVVDSQVLCALINASEKYPDAAILGSKIYYYREPKKIWYAGTEWLPRQAYFRHIGLDEIDNERDWEEIKETEYVCGCAFLIKADAIKTVGMLEPKYFLTWEEIDWCYRAKKAAYKCLLVPDSKVWHKVSASFSGGQNAPHAQYFWWRNRLLWIERNLSFREARGLYRIIFRQLRHRVRYALKRSANSRERLIVKAILQGVSDYLLRRFGDCPLWVRYSISKT